MDRLIEEEYKRYVNDHATEPDGSESLYELLDSLEIDRETYCAIEGKALAMAAGAEKRAYAAGFLAGWHRCSIWP